MRYRAEIDGLRAVAVLPVILFHAGFAAFAGGFVGVDVFFVISGYLITTIIAGELEQGRFSIGRFYARRARRILPALLLVLTVSIPFAWLWMLPEEFKDFSQGLVAVNLFASNFLFWRQSGYFEPAAEENPLLHTWSLAVEEQYYLFFPLALLALWRLGRHPVLSLVLLLALASFALSQWGWRHDPQANFYLIPTRAWELLAGALCALVLHGRPPRGNGWLAGAGLVLILGSVLAYGPGTPFPGSHALVPVAGTALVILFAAPGTLAGRLLASRGLVALGLISYSAYLWHQPLFAYARIRSLAAPSTGLMLALSGLAVALAYLSWRFVEQPFRRPASPPARRPPADRPPQCLPARRPSVWRPPPRRDLAFLAGAGAVSAGLVGFGLLGHLHDGYAGRIGDEVAGYLEAAADTNPLYTHCMHGVDHGEPFPDLPVPDCVFPPAGGAPAGRALILGDSHASAIAFPLIGALRAAGFEVTQIATAGCGPFPGYTLSGRDCARATAAIHDHLAAEPYDLTILAFRPQTLFAETPFDNGRGGVEAGRFRSVLFDHAALGLPRDAPRDALAAAVVTRGIERLAGYGGEVVVVGPIPEAGWDVPRQLARLALFGRAEAARSLGTPQARYRDRNAGIVATLAGIDHPRVHLVWPEAVLCDTALPGTCLNALDGRVLYHDDNHLSNEGAAMLAPAVLAAAAEAGARRPARPLARPGAPEAP